MIQNIKRLFPPSLKNRMLCEELMDDPFSDQGELYATLDQFSLINRLLTRSRTLLARHLVSDMVRRDLRSCTLVDIGAGGCDMAAWLIEFCAKKNIALSVTAVDHDSRVTAYARKRYGSLRGLEIVEADARDLAGEKRKFDYLFANHFLHHLHDEDIAQMLKTIDGLCRYRFLINDLRRSMLSYIGFSLGASFFFRHSFTVTDGRLSIRRGFTRNELAGFCRSAGLENTKVGGISPGRLFIYK